MSKTFFQLSTQPQYHHLKKGRNKEGMPSRMVDADDLHRQMGCMAGVFQIFHRRRRLLTARQPDGGRSTLPPGHALPSSSSNPPVQNSATANITLDKTFSKSMTENGSRSMESSRASTSSSSCSSFSSVDVNKPVQQKITNITDEQFVGKQQKNSQSAKYSKTEAKSRHPHTGFRDVVKEAINRESHGLAVKISTKESRNGLHRDSPRPLLISKSTDGTYVIGIDRSVPAYVDASSRPPRFSCDDRQLLRAVEAQDSKKNSAKLKELPRLSLDSRKESMKKLSYTRSDDNLLDVLNHHESPSHQRASSVIAKLMGLERTPDISEPARSPRPVQDAQKSGRPLDSNRSMCQDHRVTLQKNQSQILRTSPSPRNLPEAAPWRLHGVTGHDAEVKPRSASIYADIQRRLRALELSECNKELRALRILSTLHTKDTPCQSDTNAELTTSSEKFKSPIVIMKSARRFTKSDASLALVAPLSEPKGLGRLRDDEPPSTRKNEKSGTKRIHYPKESAHRSSEENSASSPRLSSSLSPRLARKKADSERRSCPPVLPVSPGKKSNEMVSPRGRLRSKHPQANSTCDHDEVLRMTERKISLVKKVDVGIIDHSNSLNAKSSFKHQGYTASTLNHEEIPTNISADKKIHPQENIQSPVSVLDMSLYHDGSSLSLKRISDSFKDGETHSSDDGWNPTSLPDTPPSKTSIEGNQIKPENMRALIQKLELLQLLSEKSLKTNDNLSSVAVNKDHQYIYEILSASGLLSNKLSFRLIPHQLRPPSFLINPEIFLILEQAKPDKEKLHRRLIFDLANEVIAKKMDINHTATASPSTQFFRSKTLSGLQLLKDLCSDIDKLQSEASMIRCSEDEEESMLEGETVLGMKGWKSFESEMQGMVLDIEKTIFKDLIDEMISGEATGKLQLRQWNLRTQLSFSSI